MAAFAAWMKKQGAECITQLVEPKINHCWELITFLRKMKSITPSQGELAAIPIEELLSLSKVEPSTLDDPTWFTTVFAKVEHHLADLLEGGNFPLQRDGKLDNVHHHVVLTAPALWALLHKLHICNVMDESAKINSGIKQVTEAVAEVNLAISIIEREAPATTLTKKIMAMSATLNAKRESIILQIVNQLTANVDTAQMTVLTCLANLPIAEDQVTALSTSEVPLTEAEEAALFTASQSVDAFLIHTHFLKCESRDIMKTRWFLENVCNVEKVCKHIQMCSLLLIAHTTFIMWMLWWSHVLPDECVWSHEYATAWSQMIQRLVISDGPRCSQIIPNEMDHGPMDHGPYDVTLFWVPALESCWC